jgi:hypothetical protein
MLVRCTQRLLKASGIAPAADPPVPASPLGEWYANAIPLRFAGRWVVLYVHVASLVAVIVPGRSLHTTLPGFRVRSQALLRRIGLPEGWIEELSSQTAEVTVARTANRQILGFMTDMADTIQFISEHVRSFPEMEWDELEADLAKTPYGVSHGTVRFPDRDLLALAGLPHAFRNAPP